MAKLTLHVLARCVKVLLAMVPPPPTPLVFDGEDNACSMHANSSPTASVHAICRALKAHALFVRPLPDGPAGGKDGKGNGRDIDANSGGSSWELDHAPDQDSPPPPTSSGAAARKVAGK